MTINYFTFTPKHTDIQIQVYIIMYCIYIIYLYMIYYIKIYLVYYINIEFILVFKLDR